MNPNFIVVRAERIQTEHHSRRQRLKSNLLIGSEGKIKDEK